MKAIKSFKLTKLPLCVIEIEDSNFSLKRETFRLIYHH